MNNKDEIIKKLQIKNGKLQIQIERLKLDKEEYYLDYLDLQQRIDKAIEYIEENACYITDGKNKEMCVDDINYDECMELLDILRGEDNDK